VVALFLRNLPWRGALIGLFCGLLSWLVSQLTVVRGLEEWMLDGCFSFRGARPTQGKVLIIGLDDASLEELRRPLVFISPELAEVVRFVAKQGVSAIGLDLIAPESLMELADLQAGRPGDVTKLGQAILEAGNVVLAQWKLEGRWLRPLPQWRLKALTNPEPTDLGFVNLTEDDDQFLRRQQLYIRDGDQGHLSFALALFGRASGGEVQWDGQKLWIGEQSVPLDSEQKLRVNFIGPPGSVPFLAFRDVLAAARMGRPLSMNLRDTIVIIGATARSEQDVHATPYANNYWRTFFTDSPGLLSGTELQANIVATLQDAAYIVPLGWLSSLPMLLAFGALLGFCYEKMNALRNLALFFACTFGFFLVHHFAWKYVCVEAFRYENWRIELLPMLILGLLVYAGNFVVRWLSTRQILGVMKDPSLLSVLEARGGTLGLQGEERVVSVLFADIRNFTTYSEQHSTREVVALLNDYFTAIVPLIEKHGGMLNQYMGDGIMVLFGAPEPAETHALQAVQTAVAVVRQVHALQEVWAQHDFPDFRIGVGVHTGNAIVGTVGSPRRLDYTAIGDVINTAARIESENKKFATEILISADTYRAMPRPARQSLGCDPKPLQTEVKGKNMAVLLYAVPVAE
jgi:adenylate cyclase